MKSRSKLLFFLPVCIVLLSACSNQTVYSGESFASDSPFKMRTRGDADMACESVRRALLGQGYLIENASGEAVKGRKALRSQDEQNTFIEMNIVCLPETNGSTLFANGLLTGYALKKSASAASVGVSAIGSISLPIGQSADSLVKVSEETIEDKGFYERFFAAVSNILGEMQADKAPPEPEAVAPEPATQPIPAAPATVEESALPQNTPTVPAPPAPVPAEAADGPQPAAAEDTPAAEIPDPLPAPVTPVDSAVPGSAEQAPVIAPEPVPVPETTTPTVPAATSPPVIETRPDPVPATAQQQGVPAAAPPAPAAEPISQPVETTPPAAPDQPPAELIDLF